MNSRHKRKLRFLILVLLLTTITIVLSGCSEYKEETSHLEELSESSRYFIYKTNDTERYLLFLENFDDSKYEIVDISISRHDYTDSSHKDESYFVTYRYK